MKILALNSSPRGDGQSKTELMLNALVRGMREAGATVETVNLRKKNIRYCIGCFSCWTKTPGVCIHKDDMSRELFSKWLNCDLAVYASPLYHYTLNASMKAFVERTLPVLEPFFREGKEGDMFHPQRHNAPKAVFLSVAGFPEYSVFNQLSSWVRFIYGREDRLVAEIYRPAAEMLTQAFVQTRANDILDATRQAGREIVESLAIQPETMDRITRDLMEDKKTMAQMVNVFWKSCIGENATPREFSEKGLIPRPDSIDTFIKIFSMGFNPQGAGDTKATLQFNFTGTVEGICHFTINNGQVTGAHGPAENSTAGKADLVFNTPFDVWMDVLTGKTDGQQAFMDKKYTVDGNFDLLFRMGELFG